MAENAGNPHLKPEVTGKNGRKCGEPPSKTGGYRQKRPKMRGTLTSDQAPGAENREKCSWSRFVEGYQERKTRKTDLGPPLWMGTRSRKPGKVRLVVDLARVVDGAGAEIEPERKSSQSGNRAGAEIGPERKSGRGGNGAGVRRNQKAPAYNRQGPFKTRIAGNRRSLRKPCEPGNRSEPISSRPSS